MKRKNFFFYTVFFGFFLIGHVDAKKLNSKTIFSNKNLIMTGAALLALSILPTKKLLAAGLGGIVLGFGAQAFSAGSTGAASMDLEETPEVLPPEISSDTALSKSSASSHPSSLNAPAASAQQPSPETQKIEINLEKDSDIEKDSFHEEMGRISQESFFPGGEDLPADTGRNLVQEGALNLDSMTEGPLTGHGTLTCFIEPDVDIIRTSSLTLPGEESTTNCLQIVTNWFQSIDPESLVAALDGLVN